MFILGLILLVVGILLILGAVTTDHGTAAFLGFDDLSASVIFFLGLGSGVAILLGLWVLKFGTKRSMEQRREQKRLHELSDQLDRVDYDKRRDNEQDRPESI